jgi:hypothetical protein
MGWRSKIDVYPNRFGENSNYGLPYIPQVLVYLIGLMRGSALAVENCPALLQAA